MRIGGNIYKHLFVLTLLAIGFGVARFLVPVTGELNQADVFKDVAHVFVGILFGYAGAASTVFNNKIRIYAWGLALGLTTLEVVAFFLRHN